MKAIQILVGNRLELVNRSSDELAPWEVRIAVAVSLVCGSDIKNINLASSADRTPGHEFAGVVTEVSVEASGLVNIGDRVTSFPMMPCHLCVDCRELNFRDCEFKEPLGGSVWPGSFATEVLIDARMAVVIPSELSLEQGALLEHLCCSYRFAVEVSERKIPPDSNFLIIGDGPIALGDLQMLLLKGYKNVSILGKHQFRLNASEDFGAKKILKISDFSENLIHGIELIDICVLAAPSEEFLTEISKRLAPGAIIIEQTRFLNEEIKRSLISSGFAFQRAFAYDISDFRAVSQLIALGNIKTDNLVTKRVSLEDFAEEYPAILEKNKNLKIAIVSNYDLLNITQ